MLKWLSIGMRVIPKTKLELIKLLKQLVSNNVIEHNSLPMLEASLFIGDLKACDVMIARHQIDFIDINDSFTVIADKIVQTGHSRFPVVDGSINKILGIFHSKDLIQYIEDHNSFNLRDCLRQVYFAPEVKKIDGLMYEMRLRHSHLAIVVDEFTNIVGLITLEMIIEQIIGDIEDEHDLIDGASQIVEIEPNIFRVKGWCKLERFNELTKLTLDSSGVETIGGYIIKKMGRLPQNRESFEFNGINVDIISADSRRINLIGINLNNYVKSL